jgi:hypothetical protein
LIPLHLLSSGIAGFAGADADDDADADADDDADVDDDDDDDADDDADADVAFFIVSFLAVAVPVYNFDASISNLDLESLQQ